MPASSIEANSRDESTSNSKTPLLDARRLAELVGFLLSVAGLLTALSLISYLPRDPSFHSTGPAGVAIHNWIGLVGAYGADLLFQVLSGRYERGSCVLTTNLAFKHWTRIFNNDATLTSAVLDRLLHHAETVTIEGKSFRMKDQVPEE